MTAIDTRPASRIVIVLLAITVVALALFLGPRDAEGSLVESGDFLTTTDALAMSDKCLTLKRKAVYCTRLESIFPAGSVCSIYSLSDLSKSDNCGS